MPKTLLALVLLLLASFASAQVVINPGGGSGTAGTGGITAGAAATGCSAFSYVYVDTGGNLACARAPINGATSTAGTAITSQLETITGASATSNWYNLTGTFPASLSAATSGVKIDLTGDNDSQAQYGLNVNLAGGGSLSLVSAVRSEVTGTGGGNNGVAAGLFLNNTTSSSAANTEAAGLVGQGAAANASANYSSGVVGYTDTVNSTTMKVFGVYGYNTAAGTAALAESAGVVGQAWKSATAANGGYFAPMESASKTWNNRSTAPAITGTVALVANNGTTTWQIFDGRDNGTSVWTIADGGYIQNTRGEVALNADYTNATATFSSTALSVDVVSGRTYSFDLGITFADSTAADGAQFDFNGGSAAATNFRVHCIATNAAGAILAQSNAAATALATANAVTLALTTQADLSCHGSFVPSGSGTFIFRAAQSAHTAGTLTIHRGSWLSVRDARPL